MKNLQKYEKQDLVAVNQQQLESEVNMQVATARRYPRDVSYCVQEAIALATSSEEVAQGCFYMLKRGDKIIDGPSVRLAEILASSWEHLRVEARISDEGPTHVTAKATVWDMQKNVSFSQEVRRGIVTSSGRRYGADMVNVTCNAAISLAVRNALFRVVPRAIIDEVYKQARKRASAGVVSVAESSGKLLDAFSKLTITREQVEFALGKKIDKLDKGDVDLMRGTYNRITHGEVTPEEWLESIGWYDKDSGGEDTGDQADEILDKIKNG